jgi:hypothetical protein
MNTQSETIAEMIPKYTVEIDFDGASQAWRANKKMLPDGCYKYVCGVISITGNKCCRKPMKDNERCGIHKNKILNI